MRPLRVYQHRFVNLNPALAAIEVTRAGETPCRAKNKAFDGLEQELVGRPDLPRTGWRLHKQQDVTHLIGQR